MELTIRRVLSDLVKVWIPYAYRLDRFADLPIQLEICPSPAELPSDPADVQFWTPPYLADRSVTELLDQMPALKVVQLLTAGAEVWINRVRDGVLLCDGQGIHTSSTAELALALILSYQRRIPEFVRAQAAGEWDRTATPTPELTDSRVLIVGAGAIGDNLRHRLEACEAASVTMVARSARPGVHAVTELPGLLPDADIVVLLVPLTPDTTGLIDAKMLSHMHDGALLVNIARGPVVVTDDLVAELRSGRLHAAMDVTDPEPLPTGHPLWTLPNVLITPHVGGIVQGLMPRAYRLLEAQLRRFVAGEPMHNVVAHGY
jgi:phosphoglycerate dehydrogenase-like enzyme